MGNPNRLFNDLGLEHFWTQTVVLSLLWLILPSFLWIKCPYFVESSCGCHPCDCHGILPCKGVLTPNVILKTQSGYVWIECKKMPFSSIFRQKDATSTVWLGVSQNQFHSTQVLFGEFKSQTQLYCAFTVALGILVGTIDGQVEDHPKRVVPTDDWKKQIPEAPRLEFEGVLVHRMTCSFVNWCQLYV